MNRLFRYSIVIYFISCGENHLKTEDRVEKIRGMICKFENVIQKEALKYLNSLDIDNKIAYAMSVEKNGNDKDFYETIKGIERKYKVALEKFLNNKEEQLRLRNICKTTNHDYDKVMKLLEDMAILDTKIDKLLTIDEWLKDYPKSNFADDLGLIQKGACFTVAQLQILRDKSKANKLYLSVKDFFEILLPKVQYREKGCLQIILDLINNTEKFDDNKIDTLIGYNFKINENDFSAIISKMTTVTQSSYQKIHAYLTVCLEDKLTDDVMRSFVDKFDDDVFANIFQSDDSENYDSLVQFVKNKSFQYLYDDKSFIRLIKNNANQETVSKYFQQYSEKKLQIKNEKDFDEIINNRVFIEFLYQNDQYWNIFGNNTFSQDILYKNVCRVGKEGNEHEDKNLLDKINELKGENYVTILHCVLRKIKRGSININDFNILLDKIINVEGKINKDNNLINILISNLRTDEYINSKELLDKIYKLTAINDNFYEQLNQRIKIEKTGDKISVKQNKDFIETYFRRGKPEIFRYKMQYIAQNILESLKDYNYSNNDEKEAVKEIFKFLIKEKKIDDNNWEIFFQKVILPDDFLNNIDYNIQEILFKYAKSETIKKIFISSDNYIGFSKNEFDNAKKEDFENLKLNQYQTKCFDILFNRSDFVSSLESDFNNKINDICNKIMDFNGHTSFSSLNEPTKRAIKDKYRDVFDACYKHFNIDNYSDADHIKASNAYKFCSKIYNIYHYPNTGIPDFITNSLPLAAGQIHVAPNDKGGAYKALYDKVHSWV